MGDRTHTEVTVHKLVYKQLLSRYGGDESKLKNDLDIDETNHDSDEIKLVCYEANYGEMKKLEKLLWDSKFEYDREWENGGEYTAGNMYCRVINGHMGRFEISRDCQLVLDKLLHLKSLPTEEVIKEIERSIEELQPFKPEPLKPPNSLDFITNP